MDLIECRVLLPESELEVWKCQLRFEAFEQYFSNNLKIMWRKEIGLYNETSPSGYLFSLLILLQLSWKVFQSK